MKFPSYFASFCGFISFAGFASAQSPTDISFSGSTVSGAANVGSLAGSFTTTDPTAGDTFSYSFVEGSGDTHNGRFDIQSDQLFVDRDLSSFPSESFLTIRVRTTDASANFFEKEFSLQIVNDSDSDGLDDSWELTYFPDLTTVSGSDNSDSDTLDNLAEQAAGTDPTLVPYTHLTLPTPIHVLKLDEAVSSKHTRVFVQMLFVYVLAEMKCQNVA